MWQVHHPSKRHSLISVGHHQAGSEPCNSGSLIKNEHTAFREWKGIPEDKVCDLHQYASDNLPATSPLSASTIGQYNCLPLMPSHHPLRNLQCGPWSFRDKVADAFRPISIQVPQASPDTGCRLTSHPVEFRRIECHLDDIPVPQDTNLNKSDNIECDTSFTPLPPFKPLIGCNDNDNGNNNNNNSNNCFYLPSSCAVRWECVPVFVCRPQCTG